MKQPQWDINTRGYFAMGMLGSKYPKNVGTLVRSAYNFGAAFIITIGARYRRMGSDTTDTTSHIPTFHVSSIEDAINICPSKCTIVGVEECGTYDLIEYIHPERALYILGAEDYGLSDYELSCCRDVVRIPTRRCLNVAVAGSIIMYDRYTKLVGRRNRTNGV